MKYVRFICHRCEIGVAFVGAICGPRFAIQISTIGVISIFKLNLFVSLHPGSFCKLYYGPVSAVGRCTLIRSLKSAFTNRCEYPSV